MSGKGFLSRIGLLLVTLSLLMSFGVTSFATAQSVGPEMLDPDLDVRPAVTGLNVPTTLAFLSAT